MTTNQNSTEILREEILADARREAEEIVSRARQEAETYVSKISAEAEKIRKEGLDQARAEAAHQSALIIATVPVETGRLRAARIDGLLECIHEEAFQLLMKREGFEYREVLIILAAHAMSNMAGADFVMKLSEEDHAIPGESLSDEIARRVGRPVTITISQEPVIMGGGVIIEDAEGRQVWDNSFVKRLERMWPELRRQIAVQAGFVPAHISVGILNSPQNGRESGSDSSAG